MEVISSGDILHFFSLQFLLSNFFGSNQWIASISSRWNLLWLCTLQMTSYNGVHLHDVFTFLAFLDSDITVWFHGSTGKCLSCLIFLYDIPKSLHSLPSTFTQSTMPWHMLQCMYCSVVYTVSHTNCLQTGMFQNTLLLIEMCHVIYCNTCIPQQSTLSVAFKL